MGTDNSMIISAHKGHRLASPPRAARQVAPAGPGPRARPGRVRTSSCSLPQVGSERREGRRRAETVCARSSNRPRRQGVMRTLGRMDKPQDPKRQPGAAAGPATAETPAAGSAVQDDSRRSPNRLPSADEDHRRRPRRCCGPGGAANRAPPARDWRHRRAHPCRRRARRRPPRHPAVRGAPPRRPGRASVHGFGPFFNVHSSLALEVAVADHILDGNLAVNRPGILGGSIAAFGRPSGGHPRPSTRGQAPSPEGRSRGGSAGQHRPLPHHPEGHRGHAAFGGPAHTWSGHKLHARALEVAYRAIDPDGLARSLPGVADIGGPVLVACMGNPDRFSDAARV